MNNNNEKKYIRSHEPVFWGLFGAGGTLTAFMTPVMILITGILVPIGLFGEGKFNYQQIHQFATSWYGAAIILILVALPLWHTFHRIFHGLHDLGIKRGRDWQQVICYGSAFAVTIFVLTLLLQMLAA